MDGVETGAYREASQLIDSSIRMSRINGSGGPPRWTAGDANLFGPEILVGFEFSIHLGKRDGHFGFERPALRHVFRQLLRERPGIVREDRDRYDLGIVPRWPRIPGHRDIPGPLIFNDPGVPARWLPAPPRR